MAITNYLVHFLTEDTYTSKKSELRNDAVAFVKDATIIHTHGTDYYCGSGPVALKSELSNYATTSALTSGLAGKANVSHTHTISQISGLQTELDSKLESVSLADLGITATAAELNYVDGVTSNIQTQLNNKAASSHNHSAANITSGTLDLARIPSITDAKITSVSASKITGTIPQANLPSYVDDVLEYSSKSVFPQTGETGKIYVDTTTNLTYRWGGSSYVEISPSLALGETSSTAFRGDRGKIAYDHSQATGNPHNLTLSNLGISATAAELNFIDGVTSNIQTQLNGKANASALSAYALKDGSNATGTWAGLSKGIGSAVSSFGYVKYNVISSDKTTVGSTETGFAWGTPLESQDSTFGNGQVLRLTWTDQFYTDIFTGPNDARTQYGIQWRQIANNTIVGGRQGGWRLLLDDYNYKNYTVTKTGEGASGTWNINISGTAASANSVAWANVSGKPSSYTPSSHTHPISQITNRGTLTFTGAATGSYDGSGNLTINIPSGGGGAGSIAWNDITGKPSTFTPAAHTHVFDDITFGNTGTNKQYLAGDGKFYTIMYSELSGTPDLDNYLTNADLSGYATQSWVNSQGFIKSATDTKNTAGSTNTSSKLFLIGATSQAANPVTYSNVSVYTQSGQLYATQMNATSGFYETSDARLKNFKEDIKSLDVVSEIPTKYFVWKSDEKQEQHIGTSAQEIQKIYPELVSVNESGELSVDYARLSIIALAAIKELKGELDKLKEELNEFKK